jgi:hypothetical protein
MMYLCNPNQKDHPVFSTRGARPKFLQQREAQIFYSYEVA